MTPIYSEFAYSREMQVILAVISCATNFVIMYSIARLLLRIYGEKASVWRKTLFALLCGSFLQCILIYIIYFINAMHSFTPIQSHFVITPNPISALVYCFLGIKILRLSPIRSIELMGHVYFYYVIIHCLNRLAGYCFFVQDPARFNYMMDSAQQILSLIIFLMIFFGTHLALRLWPNLIIFKPQRVATPIRDLIIFTAKAILIYFCVVFISTVIVEPVAANMLNIVLLTLMYISTILYNNIKYVYEDIRNKEAHIDSLIRGSDEFRAVKHDFYNILQTYSGYMDLGDLEACKLYHESLVGATKKAGDSYDLSLRMKENPAFISLLIEKSARAEQMGIHMEASLKTSVSELPIPDFELCRALACLLDNALEAAEKSTVKRVSFSIEQTPGGTKMIIITNSTHLPVDIGSIFDLGVSSKEGHDGIGLYTVNKIVSKYANCTFQLSYYNYELTAYIGLARH